MLRKSIIAGLAVCILAMLLVSQTFSEAGARGEAGTRGGREGRVQRPQREGAGLAQRDPAQMQRMMTERMKAQLGAGDKEWKVIQPRLQKVMNLSRQANASGRGMMYGASGRGMMYGGPGMRGQDTGQRARPGTTTRPQREQSARPGTADRPQREQRTRPGTTDRPQREQSAVGKAAQELQEVLRGETAKPGQIKAKLKALRTAKVKAKKDLAAAQKELKKSLTVKQEAILVLSGYLN